MLAAPRAPAAFKHSGRDDIERVQNYVSQYNVPREAGETDATAQTRCEWSSLAGREYWIDQTTVNSAEERETK